MRPTKYDGQNTINAVTEYMNQGYEDRGQVIPSIEGVAALLDVVVKTVYNWGEQHEEFLHTLDQLRTKQLIVLINKGLTGDFNSNITKLMLTKHGYSDKQETEVRATFSLSDEPTIEEWEEEHS